MSKVKDKSSLMGNIFPRVKICGKMNESKSIACYRSCYPLGVDDLDHKYKYQGKFIPNQGS